MMPLLLGDNIILSVQVNYFDQNDIPIEIIPAKIVNLVADKTTCVDSRGNIVPCNSPGAVTNEFDYFMSMIDTPVNIQDMVTQKILWADSIGRFN